MPGMYLFMSKRKKCFHVCTRSYLQNDQMYCLKKKKKNEAYGHLVRIICYKI